MFDWSSQDYSQQPVHQDKSSVNTNQEEVVCNPSYSYPLSPMEDRNYNQSFVSPGSSMASPRGSPPTSPNIVDPFGQMDLADSVNNDGAIMVATQAQQTATYTNYQVHSPVTQPMVISPESKAAPPMMPASHQVNSFENGMPSSPPISPFYTPASPTSAPVHTDNSGCAAPPSNPFDMFAPPPMPNGAPPPIPNSCQPPSNANTNSTTSTTATSQTNMDDEAAFWADMGFGVVPSSSNNDASSTASSTCASSTSSNPEDFHQSAVNDSNNNAPIELDSNSLPAGGEYYKARVTTPLIGAIFSSGNELRNTLFCTASPQFVDIVQNRPVVSFTIEGGAADTAGICPGHILLSVNSTIVTDADAAVRLVADAPRPLIMEYYIPPNVEVIKTEGQCMVKYDTTGTEAPSTSLEWKGKYVVVGDMLGKPNVVYMYRSKVRLPSACHCIFGIVMCATPFRVCQCIFGIVMCAIPFPQSHSHVVVHDIQAEYDIAVKEAQLPRRKLSVKVKKFDISHSRIFHENARVSYPNQRTSWYYFTIVRPVGFPIKISCGSREELRPIYEGVKNFLEKERKMDEKRMVESHETFY